MDKIGGWISVALVYAFVVGCVLACAYLIADHFQII